jgi:hypothetical protein
VACIHAELSLQEETATIEIREQDLLSQRQSLDGEQQAIQVLSNSIQEQYAAFTTQRNELERQQAELDELRQRLEFDRNELAAASVHQADLRSEQASLGLELESAQTALQVREVNLDDLQQALWRDREAFDQERAAWEVRLANENERASVAFGAKGHPETSSDHSLTGSGIQNADPLDTIDRLQDLLHAELSPNEISNRQTANRSAEPESITDAVHLPSLLAWRHANEHDYDQQSIDRSEQFRDLSSRDSSGTTHAEPEESHRSLFDTWEAEELIRNAKRGFTSDSSPEYQASEDDSVEGSSVDYQRSELYDSLIHESVATPKSSLPALQIPGSSTNLPSSTPVETPEALRFRAQLAEMFNVDLSARAAAAAADHEHLHQSTANVQDVAEETSPPESAEPDPVLRDDDSVDSYMQRLLARTRRANDGDQMAASDDAPLPSWAKQQHVTSAEGGASAQTAPAEKEAAKPPKEQPQIDVPAIERAPLNLVKIREGIDCLRQVANNSARSAIARSKWKRIRARFAFKMMLAVVAFAIGITILAGQWALTLAGISIWGWVSIGLGLALGLALLKDYLGIYRPHLTEEADPESNSENSAMENSAMENSAEISTGSNQDEQL